jgi:tRNA pseudouridine13 synthase
MVHRSGGLFVVENAAAETRRASALEISPTGPIYGAKMRQPKGAVRELEDSVWSQHGLPGWDDLALPRGLHVDGARRPLRVPVEAVSLRDLAGEDSIELRFELPAGSYATVLIEELFPGEAIVEGGGEGAGET